MTPEFVVSFTMEALKIAVLLSAPMLAFGLTAGLIVAIFQAVTQIHEMTLTFIPKIIAVIIALAIFFPWMLEMFTSFTTNLFISIPNYIR
ncbi:MAG: flagellar biosynthesis protein FliQ [Pseudomonadota bacterium]